jgi:hypothetical protein
MPESFGPCHRLEESRPERGSRWPFRIDAVSRFGVFVRNGVGLVEPSVNRIGLFRCRFVWGFTGWAVWEGGAEKVRGIVPHPRTFFHSLAMYLSSLEVID